MADVPLTDLLAEVEGCRLCEESLPLGPRPVVRISEPARILIIGQAPGTRVHESGVPWNDASGDRLRDWLQLSAEQFYDVTRIAIMPMGFCYPGVNERGGDLPPRPECAPQWHEQLRARMPNISLTLLVGQYAQKQYLAKRRKKTLTETVRTFESYLPEYLPTPHPSWRTNGWQKKNPWFDAELLPVLRERVADLVT